MMPSEFSHEPNATLVQPSPAADFADFDPQVSGWIAHMHHQELYSGSFFTGALAAEAAAVAHGAGLRFSAPQQCPGIAKLLALVPHRVEQNPGLFSSLLLRLVRQIPILRLTRLCYMQQIPTREKEETRGMRFTVEQRMGTGY